MNNRANFKARGAWTAMSQLKSREDAPNAFNTIDDYLL
jgi:hypothetical protein